MKKITLFLVILSMKVFNNLYAQDQKMEDCSGIIRNSVDDNYNQVLAFAKRVALDRSVSVYYPYLKILLKV